jgi:excisionase family DNA binding protein
MDDIGLSARIRDDQPLTAKETSRILRVSTVTVMRAIRAGKLKAIRVGGQWRIFPSDLLRYVDSATIPASTAVCRSALA